MRNSYTVQGLIDATKRGEIKWEKDEGWDEKGAKLDYRSFSALDGKGNLVTLKRMKAAGGVSIEHTTESLDIKSPGKTEDEFNTDLDKLWTFLSHQQQ
jgi:hypothetical protein